MPNPTAAFIDMMIHVNDPSAKLRLEAHLVEYPGVIEPRIKTPKTHLLFVSYDPEKFDIRSVPSIADALGIDAQIVEV